MADLADLAQGNLSEERTVDPAGRDSLENMQMTSDTGTIDTRQWFIVSRWQEYAGESRANLLRLIAVGAFYVVELLRFYVQEQGKAEHLEFHRQATMIAVAWTMLSLAVMLCLRLRIFPAALKYVSTAGDVLLLTCLAALVAGPFSPLVLAYFLIIALAGLRLSLGLVWFATAAGMLGYWSLVGLEDGKSSRWFDARHAVPPLTQLLTLLTLALTGVVLGQIVRQIRRVAAEYAQRLAGEENVPG